MTREPNSFDPNAFDDEIDAIGLLCPLPVLKARKRLLAMAAGQVLRLEASDPAAVIDVPHFCSEVGHVFLGMIERSETGGSGTQVYFIRRGALAAELS